MRKFVILLALLLVSTSFAGSITISPKEVRLVKEVFVEPIPTKNVFHGTVSGSYDLYIISSPGCPTYFSGTESTVMHIDSNEFDLDVLPVLDKVCTIQVMGIGDDMIHASVNVNIKTHYKTLGFDYILATDTNLYGFFLIFAYSIIVIWCLNAGTSNRIKNKK